MNLNYEKNKMLNKARQKKIMEKLNRAQKCLILGPQNLGSRGAWAPRSLLDPHLSCSLCVWLVAVVYSIGFADIVCVFDFVGIIYVSGFVSTAYLFGFIAVVYSIEFAAIVYTFDFPNVVYAFGFVTFVYEFDLVAIVYSFVL